MPVCDGLWTRVNALMIKSGAGFFRDMRYQVQKR